MPPLAKTLKAEFSYIEDAVRIKNAGSMHVSKDGITAVLENRIAFADRSLFQVFTLPMISGDPRSALDEPNSIVVDESAAMKYFGTTNVVGRSLTFDNSHHCLCKLHESFDSKVGRPCA
jgi:putative ABC transport system permease protein